MNIEEKVFNDLLDTLQKNAVKNENTIKNVSLFVRSWRAELKMEQSKINPCIPQPMIVHLPFCKDCNCFVKGYEKAMFSTNKNLKREMRRSKHCENCHYELMYYIKIFSSKKEEQEERAFTKRCSIRVIEE